MAKNNEDKAYAADNAVAAEATEAAKPATKYNFNNLNTLAVVSIATALTGFGAVAGVITGHIALAQLKTDGKQGRGLALAGMIVGYVGVGFAILSVVAKAAFGIWGIRNGIEFGGQGNFGGHQGNFGGGMMGGFGQDDQNGGMMGGWSQSGQNDSNGQNGFGGGMVQIQPAPGVTVAPNSTNG